MLLVALGAKAIATSSAAHAFTIGKTDMGHITRDEALAHAQMLVEAVPVPVSGDFENGFCSSPEGVAETVRLAGEVGLAGISIEDTDLPSSQPYGFNLAAERIRAAATAARRLKRDFMLVARADGVMNGHYDIDEAVRRIQAFEAAGADCVYVPITDSLARLGKICQATALPVNALLSGQEAVNLNYADYARLGVARLSMGSTLARLTCQAIYDAVRPVFASGDFRALGQAMSSDELDRILMQAQEKPD